MKICEKCNKPAENCGPFQCDGKSYESLCGSCKIKITLTPERKAKLIKDIQNTCKALVEFEEK